MPKIAYNDKRLNNSSLIVIDQANTIIDEYMAKGFALTLRQMYYQFVARGLLPNSVQSYKRLGEIINNGRLGGYIDWDAIEDRVRNVHNWHWDESAENAIRIAHEGYDVHMWQNQEFWPEVWIEKDALSGVVHGVCARYHVPYFPCRGFVSQSEQWRSGERFRELIESGKRVVVLHLGDHDPSGIDMTRDNYERLNMFAQTWPEVEIRRIALNMEQIEELKPPPNPAKTTDSRFAAYQANFGVESWELDALPPDYIERLIEDQIKGMIDDAQWQRDRQRREEERRPIGEIARRWNEVVGYVSGDQPDPYDVVF